MKPFHALFHAPLLLAAFPAASNAVGQTDPFYIPPDTQLVASEDSICLQPTIILQDDIAKQLHNGTIAIESFDGSNVTFSITQTWESPNSIGWIAPAYDQDGKSMFCNEVDKVEGVAPAFRTSYTVDCVDGRSFVDVFVHDGSFNSSPPKENYRDCAGWGNGEGIATYKFELSCNGAEICGVASLHSDDPVAVWNEESVMDESSEEYSWNEAGATMDEVTTAPTSGPSASPSLGPTQGPTSPQTSGPTSRPTNNPTTIPTSGPTQNPTTTAIGTNPAEITSETSGSLGDPHFRTWRNEHFEYHGQCDLILTKDSAFANSLGLDVQIRTKLVRHWSYIKSAAIRIGDDILEVEGSTNEAVSKFWINLEFQGNLRTIGGFPVQFHKRDKHKNIFLIDLSSKFPGQDIEISTFKEFVRVDFRHGTPESYGSTVGLLGDFKTGNMLARDGFTVFDDFSEFGNEWQVLPAEPMLFHDVSQPQFPKKCTEPEDPRGERRRRLDESSITEEQAEAACAKLKDAGDRKNCVYDILATQDLNMVGAY